MSKEFLEKNQKAIDNYFDKSVEITRDLLKQLDNDSFIYLDRASLISLQILSKFINQYENSSEIDRIKRFTISCNYAIAECKNNIPELVKLFQNKWQNNLLIKGDKNV